MKLYKSILLSFAAFASLAFVADTPAAELEKSLLWKIEGKNAKTSYLFGTMHLIPAEKFFMPEKVTRAFAATNKLMMELDISNQAEAVQILAYATMPNGQTIDKMISAEDYALLDSTLLAEIGMGMSIFNSYKPFVLEALLMSKMIDGDIESYETTFGEMAAAAEKPILALETVKEQMSLFDELPYEEQMTDLMKYVKGDAEMDALFAKMVDMYVAEDVGGLYEYTSEYYPDEAFMQTLLFARNAKWIPKLEQQMAKSSLFIALGAAHLGGPKGVINFLREAGYKVTAVR